MLHDVYRRFLKYLGDRKVDFQQHHHVIREMARELIEAYAENSPPNDLVFQAEADEIYRAGELFLKGHEAFKEYRPLMFEVPFGIGPGAVERAGCGLADPVRVELENGASFLLQGIIDRIDRGPDGGFVVWDYKTGSAYGYQEHGYLKRGRCSMRFMRWRPRSCGKWGAEPRVTAAGYYFPPRGEKVCEFCALRIIAAWCARLWDTCLTSCGRGVPGGRGWRELQFLRLPGGLRS